jgi:hypothetical protein
MDKQKKRKRGIVPRPAAGQGKDRRENEKASDFLRPVLGKSLHQFDNLR